MNPNEMLSSYLREVDALAGRAEEAKKQLKQLSGSLTSGDGAVTVTVNAAGALQNLTFGPRADDLPKARLASLILATARRAQIQAAQQVTSILAPIVGENSDAMRFVQRQIPVPEEPDGTWATSEPAQAPPTPPPSGPRQVGRPGDEDYGTEPVTREEDW